MTIKTLTCPCSTVGMIDTNMFTNIEGSIDFIISCPNCFRSHMINHSLGLFSFSSPDILTPDLEFEMEVIAFGHSVDDVLLEELIYDQDNDDYVSVDYDFLDEEFDLELDWDMDEVHYTPYVFVLVPTVIGIVFSVITLFLIFGGQNG